MLRRFAGALRGTWLAILVGAAWATAVAFVALATLLVVVESQRVDDRFAEAFAPAALALLLFSAHAGAIYGYITRR